MKQLAFIALIALMVLMVMPAQAQTITMANPSGIAERDIIVYYANGTMQGFYNSTSVITTDGEQDYIFTMKPQRTNPLEDPSDWILNEAFPFLQSNVIALIILAVVIGYITTRRR